MINLTHLLCGEGQPTSGNGHAITHAPPRPAAERAPSVVWNITRRCNLKCSHCYSDASLRDFPGELDWEECRDLIDSLAAFRVPGLMLSGGEPLMHPLFFYIARYAREREIRLTLSTNGTLITPEVAAKLRDIGFDYVTISFAGTGKAHDEFRGCAGAFGQTVAAFRNCRAAGQEAGVRIALTKTSVEDLDSILNFIEQENIPRVCFYHLTYGGRGVERSLPSPVDTRAALDKIMDRIEAWQRDGQTREILTLDQPADGPYLLMRLQKADPARYRRALELLRGDRIADSTSGVDIANIDTQGNVHPDQFWQDYTLGNIRKSFFGRIWRNPGDPLLLRLRSDTRTVKGRCATCGFLPLCGGGFRVRAWQRFADPLAEDPGCYLDESEISAPAITD